MKLLFQIQEQIFSCLKQEKSKFEAIQKSAIPLVNKWQKFLEVVLPIQIKAVQESGFGGDQAALAHFNDRFLEESVRDPALRELNEKKWIYLFETAFGFKEQKKLSLEQARDLIQEIASAMSSEPFLREIDRVMETLPNTPR